jgi:hypothetical protein
MRRWSELAVWLAVYGHFAFVDGHFAFALSRHFASAVDGRFAFASVPRPRLSCSHQRFVSIQLSLYQKTLCYSIKAVFGGGMS